jgi:hypothetical protein
MVEELDLGWALEKEGALERRWVMERAPEEFPT